MINGGKGVLFIPSGLGYSENTGNAVIPPNSNLIILH